MTVDTTTQTALAVPGSSISGYLADYQALTQIMADAVDTDFVPAHFRPQAFVAKNERPTPDALARARNTAIASAAIGAKFGISLGLGGRDGDPFAALQNVYVVGGRPGLYAAAMVAVVQADGHEIWTEDLTDSRAVVCGRRRGSEHVERVVVTMDQAKKAGWTRNAKYNSEPQAMLLARAQASACRRVAQDALKGMGRAAEELDDDVAVTVSPAPSGTRTVQRAPRVLEQAKAATAGAHEFVQQAHAAGTPSPAADAPPLPGEDDRPPDAEPVTDGQLRALGAMFSDLGVKGTGERADRLAVTADIVGRPITSAKDLTRDEASTVLDTLRGNGPEVLAKVLGRGPAGDQPPAAEPAAGDELAVPGDDEVVVEDPPGGEDYDPTLDQNWGQQR